MTVSAQTTFASYAGAGLTGPYTIPFAFASASEVVVEKIAADGTVTVLTGNTITGGQPTGTLYTAAVVAVGDTVQLYRSTPLIQPADYIASDAFPAETHEGALDRLTRIVQELSRDVGRAFKVALGGVGFSLSLGIDGVLAVRDGVIVVRDDLVGDKGDKGDPGSGGGAIGLFTDIATLILPAGTDLFMVTGRVAKGDGAAGKLFVRAQKTLPTPLNPTGVMVEMEGDFFDAAGTRCRWAPGQAFCPEMFENDAETNALPAFRKMHDLANYYGGGNCVGQPGATYLFPNVGTTMSFVARTFRRHDGKTCTYSYIGRGVGDARDPQIVGVDFYSFDGQGCSLVMDGAFNLTAADYQNSYRKRDTRIVWDMWKCANVVLENFTWDGQWGLQTTDTGASGECWSYCIRLTGVAGCEISHVIARNGAQDFVVTAHRNKASLNGILLTSTEAYPEPDQSTVEVHDPAGIMHSLVVRSCVIDSFRRQGFSPVGVGFRDQAQDFPGFSMEDSIVANVGRYPGTAQRWFAGDPTDGSIKWAWRGFPPRSAVDFEPVRVSGYQVTDNAFRNCSFIDCIGSFAASTGSWGRARVEQSLPFSAVDVTANTFTKTAQTLPRTRAGGIPAKIRCWSDNTLPGGLAEKTDYYLSKISDTAFRLHLSPADAITGTNPVDITGQGTGNHWFIWIDTPPNVGKITFDGCTMRHPADGSVLPMQVNCEHLRVVNCDIHIASGTGYLGPNAVYKERQTWENNRITFVRAAFDIDNYAIFKTQNLNSGAVNTTTDTLTLDADDGLGKFEFVPIKMRVSGTGTPALPSPLTQGHTYYMVRTGALTRKFATTVRNARNGTYVDLTTTGSGLLSYYRDIAQYDVKGNSFEQMSRTLEFDGAQVSTTTGRIPIASLPFLGEGVMDSEHFEIVAVTTGAMLPTGFTALTTYYTFQKYGDPGGVYLASTSPDANAHIPIIPTVAGSGKLRLAATVTQTLIDVLDANSHFTDNIVILDTADPTTSGTMARFAGLFGLYGGNLFTAKGGGAPVFTVNYARMTVDRADVLKGGFVSSGP